MHKGDLWLSMWRRCSLGYVSVNDSCKSLSFSHVNYESRLVNLKELNDTVFLISKLLNIKEVVVFGHGQRNELPEALKRQLEIDKKEAQLAAINPSSGNLLALLSYIIPKKWRKSKKEKQRQKVLSFAKKFLPLQRSKSLLPI